MSKPKKKAWKKNWKPAEAPAEWKHLLNEAITKPGILSDAFFAFHDYSIGNQIMAWFQCNDRGIELGPIATFAKWKERGRYVKKDEHGLILCRPITVKREVESADGSEEDERRTFFVYQRSWFVLAQTDGDEWEPAPIDGWNPETAMEELSIERLPFTMPNGNCQGCASKKGIAINPVATLPMKTMIHEIAHIVLGHTAEADLKDDDRTPRDLREIEAESVAYILCNIFKLDGIEESRGYIQNWMGESNEIPEKNAKRIFTAAQKILAAGGQR